MFTSGSTGEPKGVKISHFNLIFFINWVKKTFKINKNSIMTNLNPYILIIQFLIFMDLFLIMPL